MTAICQAIFNGIEGRGVGGRLYCKYVELHKAVNIKKPDNNPKAKALWLTRDAKTNGEACYDRSSERPIESRTSVRQALWQAHMKSPAAALEEPLRRTEDGAGMALYSTAGSSETRATFLRLPSQSGCCLSFLSLFLSSVRKTSGVSMFRSVPCLLQRLRFHHGLQQLGDGGLGRHCTGIASDTTKLERVFNSLKVCGGASVFSVVCREGGRRISTGSAFLRAAA